MKRRRVVGEFAVIVLGVLTALLAESFVTGLREASEAEGYRVRLKADLADDVQRFDEVAAYFGRVGDSGAKARGWIDTGHSDLIPIDLFVHLVNAASFHPILVARDTWDDLVSTGKVALLDEAERIALSNYYRTSQTFIADLGDIPGGYRTAIQGHLPVEPFNVVFDECVLYESLATDLPSCQADLGLDPESAFTALREVPGFAEDLNRAMHGVRTQIDLVVVLSDHAATVLDEIGS